MTSFNELLRKRKFQTDWEVKMVEFLRLTLSDCYLMKRDHVQNAFLRRPPGQLVYLIEQVTIRFNKAFCFVIFLDSCNLNTKSRDAGACSFQQMCQRPLQQIRSIGTNSRHVQVFQYFVGSKLHSCSEDVDGEKNGSQKETRQDGSFSGRNTGQ